MKAGAFLSEAVLAEVQTELAARDLDGWLLYEFRHQNPVSAALLAVGKTTRRTFVLIPREGRPTALIHAIEHSAWRHWPWDSQSYAGWYQLETGLAALLQGRRSVAMEVSERCSVPTLDLVPSGVVDLVREAGVTIHSSGDLVTRFHSIWSQTQLERHRAHAEIIKDVARAAFEHAAQAIRSGSPTSEGPLGEWILAEMAERGLVGDRDCHVAVDAMASDPHYGPVGAGETIGSGSLLMIDLWGKADPDDVWADQTWMGYMGSTLPQRHQTIWSTVRDARDRAIDFVRERHAQGAWVRGFEVDDVARAVIVDAGFGEYFIHRTGHSMDRAIHGRGPNLDNLETRDDRVLLPGVGFSVEPGIYIPGEIGVRSEVNVHLGESGPEVTPGEPQTEVFLLLDD